MLLSLLHESTPEGRGYVELSRLINIFEDRFDNRQDVLVTLDRLVSKQLIDANTRSTENIQGASHVRVTSAGWYYVRYLVKSFAYLDLVLQDTPVEKKAVCDKLTASVRQVDNLSDKESKKTERVRARFVRVGVFLDYLREEEDKERAHFDLYTVNSPIAELIVPPIRAQFEQEKKWIERRLRNKRERFEEELPLLVSDEDKEMLRRLDALR
jgi:hypothetical protein